MKQGARTTRRALHARRLRVARSAPEARCARSSRDPLCSHVTWKARKPLTKQSPLAARQRRAYVARRRRPEPSVNQVLERGVECLPDSCTPGLAKKV